MWVGSSPKVRPTAPMSSARTAIRTDAAARERPRGGRRRPLDQGEADTGQHGEQR